MQSGAHNLTLFARTDPTLVGTPLHCSSFAGRSPICAATRNLPRHGLRESTCPKEWTCGKQSAVTECKRMIDEIINNRQQQNSSIGSGQQKNNNQREMDHLFIVKVKVPNNKVGIIIGKGGVTVKMIMERSRAQIQIPSNPDEDNPNVRTLSIGGDTKESVENAQAEITIALQQSALALGGPIGGSLMNGSGSGVSHGLSQFMSQQPSQQAQSGTAFVLVPDDKVGVIIGKGGVTIKELQSRLRVKISIPQGPDAGSNPPVRTCR